jgi:hypothetical protein
VKPILAFLAVAALVLLLIWAGQRRLIYFPYREAPSPSAYGLPEALPVTFATEDGLTLNGWFVPAGGPVARWTVVVFNGNAGHRGYRAPLAAALARRGIATLLFDYRGYGDNPGSPSEEGLARDARGARAYLAGRPDLDSTRLVFLGESLGAAVAVRLAAEAAPAGLILRSPFTSLADVGRHHYPILPVRLLLRERYPSIERIARVRCPVLVIAGERDGIIPAPQSERLARAAPRLDRLVVIPGADHNDGELLAGPRLVAAVAEFLERLERRAP